MNTANTLELIADLKVTVPAELVEDFLAKLHYVSESLETFALQNGARNSVRFTLNPGSEQQAELVATRIAEVAQKMCAAYRPAAPKVLVSREGKGTYQEDPQPALFTRGDLFKYGAGRFGLGPALVELMEVFDSQLRRLIAKFAAEQYQFPTLIGGDVLERCKYLRAFPHALTLASHLREDLAAVQGFSDSVHYRDGHLAFDPSNLAPSECLLAPTICFHCFAWLENSNQTKPRAITAVGKCFRYESGNLEGLERLWDFTMRELIFVGTQDYVTKQRELVIAESAGLIDEWGLGYEIKSATDPFFIEEYATATFQLAFDLKYEARAKLPYKDKTLAIASFNLHQDFFGSSLNIKTEDGKAAFTGCVGFGLERVVLAFLAQHGPERRNWPASVARELS